MPSDIKGMLTHKVGPLPVYIWLAGGAALFYVIQKRKAATANATQPAVSYPALQNSPFIQYSYGGGPVGGPGDASSGTGTTGTTQSGTQGSQSTQQQYSGAPISLYSGPTIPGNPVEGQNPSGAIVAPPPGPNVYGPAGWSFSIGPGTPTNGEFIPPGSTIPGTNITTTQLQQSLAGEAMSPGSMPTDPMRPASYTTQPTTSTFGIPSGATH
jgi:hypothetical protein